MSLLTSVENAHRQMRRRALEMARRKLEERSRYWTPQSPPGNDQQGAYLSLLKVLFVLGGNRSGKTELAVKKVGDYCSGRHPTLSQRRKPPVFGRIICTSWDTGVAVAIKKLKQMVRRNDLLGGSWDKAYSPGRGQLTFCMPGQKNVPGSMISFLTSTQDVDAHRGDDLDFVVMDEHHEQKYYTENMARLVDRDGWMMLTMTPEEGRTWEDMEILERIRTGHPNYGFYQFDSTLNPHLSKDGLQALIDSVAGSPELFQAKIKGQMVALEGLVYPMFRREIHVRDHEWVMSHKFTHRQVLLDPHLKKEAALLWLGWTKEGQVFAYREQGWRPNVGGIEDLATLIRVRCNGEKINDWIVDEALGGDSDKIDRNVFGEKDLIVQLNDLGLPFVGTNVASDKNVKAGILKLRQFLRVDPSTGLARVYISRECVRLVREALIYQFRKATKTDDENYRERLRNIDDHWITLLRYGVMAEPTYNLPEQIDEKYDPESGLPIGPGYRTNYSSDDDAPYGEEELS